MTTAFSRLRLHKYADYLEQLLEKNQPDYIVALETRGARLVEAILEASARLAVYSPRLLYLNACQFFPSNFEGKRILLLDDSAYYGSALMRAIQRLEKLHLHIIPAAFAICDDPALRKDRAKRNVTHFDVLERLDSDNYAQLVGEISEFIRSRGVVTPVDATIIDIQFSEATHRVLPKFLGALGKCSTLSEYRHSSRYFDKLSFSAHWPTLFEPNSVATNCDASFDGILKIRAIIDPLLNTARIAPMVHSTIRAESVRRAFQTTSEDVTFEALRSRVYSHFRGIQSEDESLVAYDLVGLYFELRLGQRMLAELRSVGVGISSVSVPREDFRRYYGPELGPQLAEIAESTLRHPSSCDQQLSLFEPLLPLVVTDQAEPADGDSPFPRSSIELVRTLRRTYGRWNKRHNRPRTGFEPYGYSFPALCKELRQSRLWTSEFLDYMCDTTLLAPFNQISEDRKTITRAYRAGEDRPLDLSAVCAWVIALFEVGSGKRRPVPAVVIEKSLVAMAEIFDLFELEPRIDTYRSLYGPRPSFQERTTFIRPRIFTVASLPSDLYHRTEEGYLTTNKFDQLRKKDAIPLPLDLRCSIEDCAARLQKLYNLRGRSANLTLVAILAYGAFGLDAVSADLELSIRASTDAANQSNLNALADRKRLRAGLADAAGASSAAAEKIELLDKATDFIVQIRKVLSVESTRENAVLKVLMHLPKNDPLLRIMAAIQRLWSDCLGIFSAGSQKPAKDRLPFIRALSEAWSGLTQLMGRATPDQENFSIPQSLEDLIVAIGDMINIWCAALGRARQVIQNSRAASGPRGAMFVIDLTGFVKVSMERPTEAFGHAALEAMDAVYAWLQVFGAIDRIHGTEGDKVIAGFADVRSALFAAICTVHQLESMHIADRSDGKRFPFKVKVGIDSGQAIATPNDLLSRAINIASRLCEAARNAPGNILTSDQVRQLLAGSSNWFQTAGKLSIKSGGVDISAIDTYSVVTEVLFADLVQRVEMLRPRMPESTPKPAG